MLSKQEVFDKVVEHALTQKQQARGKAGGQMEICMYRTPEGLKCFIGALIPDEEYTPELEGREVDQLLSSDRFGLTVLPIVGVDREEAVKFYLELQRIHDERKPEQWPELLRGVARQYELSIPEVLKEILK